MGLSRLIVAAVGAYFAIIPPSFPDAAVLGAGGEMPTLAPFLDGVTPAVVDISAIMSFEEVRPVDDALAQFPFDLPIIAPPHLRSSGSGVIVDAENGLIVTNNHLVDGAELIVVTLKDKRAFEAVLVGADAGIDVALLKISASDLTDLPPGNSDKLRVGDYIVAIGNPFGLGQSVSTGIVSALGLTELGIEQYEDFVQIDAPINPGDSGGALVNMRGELVGINTAIVSISGGNVGIGFAIPVNLVRASAEQLLKHGEVRRGWIGLGMQDLTPSIAAVMGASVTEGAIVNQVFPEGPALRAGIRAGDVIVAVDGKSVRDAGQVRNRVGMIPLGEIVRVRVTRDGRAIGFSMHVEEPPAEPEPSGTEGQGPLAGARFEASRADPKGIEIVDLALQAPLARAGLQPGDVIVAVNRRRVTTVEALFQSMVGIGPFTLLVRRDNAELFLVLR